jgi:hypothetical protein
MYPSGPLRALAARRDYLQLRIALRREQCVQAGRGVEQGVNRISGWVRILRAGSLLGAVGLSLWGARKRRSSASGTEAGGHSSLGGKIIRWAPLAFRAARLVSGF